jgi:hypothetical protein
LPTNLNDNVDVDVFEQAENANNDKSMIAPGEIILGTIISIDSLGQPKVNFPLNPEKESITAITTVALTSQHISRQVALLFNQGDLSQPIVIGLIHSPLQAMLDNFQQDQETCSEKDMLQPQDNQVELAAQLNTDNVCIDGKRLTFEAKDEMVFKCGQSSITLTKEGKVLIRGKYLLNRSSGVNRIMGGSVQVN